MKIFCLLLLLGVALVLGGCDETPVEQPDSIEYFVQTGVQVHHCEGAANCGEFHIASITDDNGSPGWYWLAFERNDTVLYAGDGKYVTEPYNNFRCTLDYYYWAYVEPDSQFYDCDLMVYRSDIKPHVGDRTKRTSSGGPKAVTLTHRAIVNCETCCCTGQWYYAEALRLAQNDVHGARADITPRYRQICDPNNDTSMVRGHLNGMVSVRTAESGGAWSYAEIGFYKGPAGFPGETRFGLIQVVGWAVGAEEGFQRQRFPSIYPDTNSSHNFALDLDQANGTWSYYYDGNELNPITDTLSIWTGRLGDYAVWMGEIFGHESDMPGTSQNKCYFDDCEVFDGQDWYAAELQDLYPWGSCIVESDDPSEWMIFVTDSASFYMYDINPLP